jgi:hypothetical protein
MKQTQAHQSTQVVPDFGDVRVQAYRTGVSIKRISVLVDLVIQNANRAPKSWIPTVTIYSLLIGFICFWVFLL